MKKRLAPVFLILYFLAFIVFVFLIGYFGRPKYRIPKQPINFSHKIHVSKVGLKCTFCHTTVEKSTFAGIPSVQKCMSCHKAVAKDKPEIRKLIRFWVEQQPIPWERVHVIPVRNYVYFSHKRHIKAGLQCATCHGEVQVMSRVRRVRNLEMGWCVSCHKANHAPTDCTTCHK